MEKGNRLPGGGKATDEDWMKVYEKLNSLIKDQKHDEIVKLCQEVLVDYPDQEQIWQTMTIGLINADQFKEALERLQKKGGETYLFETAYCYFQLNDFIKAMNILISLEKKDERATCLLGQIYYKQGNYSKCIECYEKLEASKSELVEELEKDITINITSACIQQRMYRRIINKKYFESLKTSSDGLLTLSIALTEEGRLDEAYFYLKEGLRQLVEEDPELEPWNDFQLHHLHILHYFQGFDSSPAAQQLRSQLKTYIKSVPSGESELIVSFSSELLGQWTVPNNTAVNNRVATDRLLNSESSLKLLDRVKTEKNSSHEATLYVNRAILLLRQKKIEEAKEALEKAKQIQSEVLDERYLILEAYILMFESKEKAALILEDYLKSHTGEVNDFIERQRLYANLYLAQIRLLEANWQKAIEYLTASFKMAPRLCENENFVVFSINTIKALFPTYKGAQQALLEIMDFLQKKINPTNDKNLSILAFLADCAFMEGKPANQIFEVLMKQTKERRAEVGFAFTKCAFDGDNSEDLDRKLGEFKMDLEDDYKKSLLDETRLKAVKKKAQEEEKKGVKSKQKKHKKGRLPKDVDSKVQPDPERWLPKWKRLKYRKHFKNMVKLRETQGDASAPTQIGAYAAGPSSATVSVSKHKKKK